MSTQKPLLYYMRSANTFLRTVTAIVVITFGMLILAPTAMAARSEVQRLKQQASLAPSDEEKMSLVMQKVEAKLSELQSSASAEKIQGKKRELRELRDELLELDETVSSNFDEIGKRIKQKKLSSVILKRHQDAVQRYRQGIKDTLLGIDGIEQEKRSDKRKLKVKQLSEKHRAMKHKRSQQPFDPENLPTRLMRPQKDRKPKLKKEEYKQSGLFDTPHVKLAALGDFTFDNLPGANDPAYLAPSDEVVLTQAIQDKAAELEHDPIKIHNWVRNNIQWQPTWGAVQNAELTLSAKRGNSMDISSLTIALLRASGIPSRYVHGAIDVPVEKFKNWAGGFSSTEAAVNYASAAGIPITSIISGGQIVKVRLEHIWVEAATDYFPSRGAKNLDADSWISMDPSYKQYEYQEGLDAIEISGIDPEQLAQSFLDSGTVNEDESFVIGFDSSILKSNLNGVLNSLQQYVSDNNIEQTRKNIIGGSNTIIAEYPVLPSGLPNHILVIGARYGSLPSTLQHRVRLELFNTQYDRALGTPSLTYNLSLSKLSDSRLGLTYIPATEDDASVIETAISDAQDTLPLYLIKVKPEIRLENTPVVTGNALSMGSDHFLDVVMTSPLGESRMHYTQIVGDEIVVGINGGGVSEEQVAARRQAVSEVTSLESLYMLSLLYWYEADEFTQMMAKSIGVKSSRLPSVGVFSSPLSVIYSYGIPNKGYYKNTGIDIKRNIHAVGASNNALEKQFVVTNGSIHSYLESSILEQAYNNWQGTGLSAMQVLIDANQQGIPIYEIDSLNSQAILQKLNISDTNVMSDINQAIQVGMHVIVPETMPTKSIGVNGAGYILMDPDTGFASYRISGGLDGGEGGAPCAEKQSQPITQAINDIVTTLVILAMLAALAAIIFGSGGTAAPVLARLMVAMGLSALTFSATAGSDVCTPIPTPRHLGGPQGYRSGLCADTVIGNQYPGGDVCVNGVYFDALTQNTMLWEVKVIDFNENIDLVVDFQINKDFKQRDRQIEALATCPQYSLNWAVAHERHYTRARERSFHLPLNIHKQVPECFDLPTEP